MKLQTIEDGEAAQPPTQISAPTGIVQLYTGTGKGKTTAALGLGLRAAGHGWKVLVIQFMKGKINYGELQSVKHIPGMSIEQFGRPDFVDKDNPAQVDIDLAVQGFQRAKEAISSEEYNMLILDEINVAVDFKLLDVTDVLELVENRPPNLDMVLTGRYAPRALVDLADLVTVMAEVKHPYAQGIDARQGIDF